MKKTVVLSLGGSLIVPEKIDFRYLDNFRKTLKKFYKTHRFVVVAGGGVIARKYISVLQKEGRSNYEISRAGIRATRMNAEFLMQFFGKREANDRLPMNMKQVKSSSSRNSVVFCGALRFAKNSTSDSTAAKLAHYLGSEFINLTDVEGLYTANPKTNPKAKFVRAICHEHFEALAFKLKFRPGQNFVLDQNAAYIIKKHKIPTYILGKNLNNLSNLLNGKSFTGTTIH